MFKLHEQTMATSSLNYAKTATCTQQAPTSSIGTVFERATPTTDKLILYPSAITQGTRHKTFGYFGGHVYTEHHLT